MSCAVGERISAVDLSKLQDVLQQILNEFLGRPCGIVRLERRPFANTSSYAIEELEIELDSGTRLSMLFKDLGRDGLVASAQNVKPAFLHNPLREIGTYRVILGPARLGAICYGSAVLPESGRYWLFLEKVAGIELYQEGDLAVWRHVAAWLARMHARFAGPIERFLPAVPLLVHDRNYYWEWLRRAQAIVGGAESDDATRALARLATAYDRIIDRLLALPKTLLHGEFYASNVLVEKRASDVRVCPVDWEMAAIGPGLIDLAALTAGNWSDAAKEAMAQTYYDEFRQSQRAALPWEEMCVALDCCRLHLAIQWLGWSPRWAPPPAQRQDWLGEALHLAGRLLV